MAESRSGAIEKRITRLEQIVSRLEREELELDEALGLFEEGITHRRERAKPGVDACRVAWSNHG